MTTPELGRHRLVKGLFHIHNPGAMVIVKMLSADGIMPPVFRQKEQVGNGGVELGMIVMGAELFDNCDLTCCDITHPHKPMNADLAVHQQGLLVG